MNIETYILFLKNKIEAERIEGSVFKTLDEAREQLGGEVLADSQKINCFTEEWNDLDSDKYQIYFNYYFVSYIYIIK